MEDQKADLSSFWFLSRFMANDGTGPRPVTSPPTSAAQRWHEDHLEARPWGSTWSVEWEHEAPMERIIRLECSCLRVKSGRHGDHGPSSRHGGPARPFPRTRVLGTFLGLEAPAEQHTSSYAMNQGCSLFPSKDGRSLKLFVWLERYLIFFLKCKQFIKV